MEFIIKMKEESTHPLKKPLSAVSNLGFNLTDLKSEFAWLYRSL